MKSLIWGHYLDATIASLNAMGEIKIGKPDGSDFELKSGKMSPLYVDLRGIGTQDLVLEMVAKFLAQEIEGVSFDHLAGLPQAGTPLATATALAARRSNLTLRTKLKEHGSGGGLIMGRYQQGDTLCLVDNVITSGATVLDYLDPLAAHGLLPTHCLVFVDREEGGAAVLEERGIQVLSVTTLKWVVESLHNQSIISAELYWRGNEYMEDSDAYQAKYYPGREIKPR